MPPFDANPLMLQLLLRLAPQMVLGAQLAGTDALAPTRKAKKRDQFGTRGETISKRPGTASHSPRPSALLSPGVTLPGSAPEAVRMPSEGSQGLSRSGQRPGTAKMEARPSRQARVRQRATGLGTEVSKNLLKSQFFGNDQMHHETGIHRRGR